MQVTETLSDGLKRGYTVVLPAENLDSRRNARLADLGKTINLPGFRPGKVPLAIIRQRYGTAVSAEVVDQSVNEAMQTVLSERGLRPVRQPTVALVTENPTAPGIPIEFSVEMEVMPTIVMPDFATIALTRLKTEVGPDLIEEALIRIAKANRTLKPLSAEDLAARPEGDRAVAGDVLTVDFLGKIDDVPFDGGAGSDVEVEIGGEDFIPGFADQLVGAKPGEARTIAVTFPDKYGKAELAGKAATFEITVKQISSQTIPPIDDALATDLGLENEAALRELVRSRQQTEYDQVSRVRLKKALMDSLAGLADFLVPPSMLEDEFKQIWDQFEKARAEGRQDEEDKAKDDDTLRADYRSVAERRIRLGLLLAEIGLVNAISVTEQELDRAIAARVSQYRGQERQMYELYRKYPELSNSVRGPLLEDKVVDFILELATVTDQVVTVDELLKEEDEAEAPVASPLADVLPSE